MKTVATVVSVNGDVAVIETERTSACEGCHKKSEDGKGCAVCSLVGGGNRKFQARAENRIGAQVGDCVSVESATSRVLFYAALVFLLPLAICTLGWGITARITPVASWRLVGAAVGFVLSFVGLRIYSGVVKKRQADVVITGIISRCASESESRETQDNHES